MNQLQRALKMNPFRLMKKIVCFEEIYTIGYRKRDGHTLLDSETLSFDRIPFDENCWYADPILVAHGEKEYLLMESFDMRTQLGSIACSAFQDDGKLSEPRIIIQEEYHMSFPMVFAWNDGLYMIPETCENRMTKLLTLIFGSGKEKIKWGRLLLATAVLGLAIYVVGKPRIEQHIYIGYPVPRIVLHLVGITVLMDFFPLGSGFGTFASYLSGRYYSNIYELYGISDVFGMTREKYNYISDVFWPYIYGQFGIFGLMIYVKIIFSLFPTLDDNLALRFFYYLNKHIFYIFHSSFFLPKFFEFYPIGYKQCDRDRFQFIFTW